MVLCMSLVLVVASNNSLNIAIPDLQRSVHATESQLEWIVDTYSIVLAGLLFTAGSLADRFGRRRTMQLGLGLFAAASLVAVFSHQAWQLIVLRGIMGGAAAFIMPSTLSILTDIFRGPERGKAIGVWSGFAGAGGAIGMVASGLLLQHFSWSSVFLLNVPVAIVVIVVGMFVVPRSGAGTEAPLDPLGVSLSVVGFACMLFGIIEGPSHGWTSLPIVAFLSAGAAVLAAFVGWELHVEHPMLDPHLFRHRRFSVGAGTIFLGFFAAYGLAFVLTQYLQFSLGYSALFAGLALLPLAVAKVVSAPNSARAVHHFGPRAVVAAGLLVSAGGLAVLSRGTSTTSYLVLVGGLVLLGVGSGQTNAPSTTLIMNTVREAKGGVGSAVNDTTRETGGALGIAVLGSIMEGTYRHALSGHLAGLPSAAQIHAQSSFTATAHVAHQVGGVRGARLLDAGRAALAQGFSTAMLTAGAVLVVMAFAVLVFQRPGAEPAPQVEPIVPEPARDAGSVRVSPSSMGVRRRRRGRARGRGYGRVDAGETRERRPK